MPDIKMELVEIFWYAIINGEIVAYGLDYDLVYAEAEQYREEHYAENTK